MYCFRDVVLSPFGQSRNTTFSIPPRRSHKLSSSPFPPEKTQSLFFLCFLESNYDKLSELFATQRGKLSSINPSKVTVWEI